MRRGAAGFTVIEVIVVMAIAGMMLLGAFVAMTSSIDSTRFTDTMTTTQSYMQKQYLEVVSGKNIRDSNLKCDAITGAVSSGSDTPGGSDCILLGRLLKLSLGGGTITTSYIVGTAPASLSPTATDNQAVIAYSPKAVSSLTTTFEVPWSARMRTATQVNSGVSTPYIAIMRSPISERMMVYSLASEPLPAVAVDPAGGNLNKKVDICIDSDGGFTGRTAHLMIGAGQGQDLFTIERVSSAAC